MRTFVRRVTTLSASLLVLPVLGAPVASADEALTVEMPMMFFGFNAQAGYHDICGNGFLREPPSPNPMWTLQVYGGRVPSGTPIVDSDVDTAQNGFPCVRVDKLGNAYGTYTATFRYEAFPNDPPSVIDAEVVWFPGTNGEIVAGEQ